MHWAYRISGCKRYALFCIRFDNKLLFITSKKPVNSLFKPFTGVPYCLMIYAGDIICNFSQVLILINY
jgi:hypothetical protein